MIDKNKKSDFSEVAAIIKEAIIRSRYQAAKLVNKELLGLYYAVGKYVSQNSRNSVWGQNAIRQISESLQCELPGLRGFSEVSIKRMRLFFEAWYPVFTNRPLVMDDFTLPQEVETYIEDENDPDERLIERGIIANIKQFILSFGNKFCFIGNQYRIMVDDKEFFIDLLFFNRELHCLVAVELKRGEFKPSHLGQLNFYLSALDEYVRQADEAPSIGIILCKEANRNIVEFAVRDYTKPMGVATYRTRNEMPEKWKKALPDFDDMKKLLENTADETDTGIDE